MKRRNWPSYRGVRVRPNRYAKIRGPKWPLIKWIKYLWPEGDGVSRIEAKVRQGIAAPSHSIEGNPGIVVLGLVRQDVGVADQSIDSNVEIINQSKLVASAASVSQSIAAEVIKFKIASIHQLIGSVDHAVEVILPSVGGVILHPQVIPNHHISANVMPVNVSVIKAMNVATPSHSIQATVIT